MSHYIPTEKEILEMLSNPDLDTVKGRRDRAILEVLYSTGLRRMEMHNLNLDDVDFTEGVVRVFQGKMRKDRVVPVGKVALKALMLYLTRSRPKWVKDTRERALFLERKGGRLSIYMYYQIVTDYSPNKRINVHSIRHACATHMLKRGADILHIQKFLGHTSPKTTEIYTKLFPKDLVEACEKIKLREEGDY